MSSKSTKMLQGSLIYTSGALISRVIGLLYVIPFNAMVGEEGQALYAIGYLPFIIMLNIATAGFPPAISKFTAKYNAMGEYKLSRKIFKASSWLMVLLGFISFVLLWVFAPFIATLAASNAFTVEEVTTVIRAVSFGLIIIPSLSIIRGYFQGHGQMVPTSVSQLVEQLTRVIFLLVGVFVALYVFETDIVAAVSVATFAAFVGAAFGLLIMYWFWHKQRSEFREMQLQDVGQVDLKTSTIFKDMLIAGIPFIVVAIALQLFQLVDMATFNRTMTEIGYGETTDAMYGMLFMQIPQLVMIPLALATGFQNSLVPSVTAAVTEGDKSAFKNILDDMFNVLLAILIPAVVGMIVLAEPIYGSFYGVNEVGTQMMVAYAPMVLVLSLFSVSAAILQGMDRQWFAVKSFAVGFVFKAIFNVPLMMAFGWVGSVMATMVGFIIIVGLNFYVIKKHSGYSFSGVYKKALVICVMSLAMGAAVLIERYFLASFGIATTPVMALAFCIPVGGLIYGALAYKTGMLEAILGNRLDRILIKLRIKKASN